MVLNSLKLLVSNFPKTTKVLVSLAVVAVKKLSTLIYCFYFWISESIIDLLITILIL